MEELDESDVEMNQIRLVIIFQVMLSSINFLSWFYINL